MDCTTLANHRWLPKMGLVLCNSLPRELAYALGEGMADAISLQARLPLVRAITSNVAVALDLPNDHAAVKALVPRILRNFMRAQVDLYRAVREGPGEIMQACEFDPSLLQAITQLRQQGRGLVLAGAHTTSFDLLLLALSGVFPAVQALTTPNQRGSTRAMNAIRARFGLRITPVSSRSLKEAVQNLRAGGVVVTGIDIPDPHGAPFRLFGHQARLPLGHARLAQRTGADLIVGACGAIAPGRYLATGTIVSQPDGSRDDDGGAARWAQRSYNALEGHIRRWIEEWVMPHPLWPERMTAR